jgi:hypothetical protein
MGVVLITIGGRKIKYLCRRKRDRQAAMYAIAITPPKMKRKFDNSGRETSITALTRDYSSSLVVWTSWLINTSDSAATAPR